MDFHGNGGFGASPARSSVWCSPAGGFFFSEKHNFWEKTCFLMIFKWCFIKKSWNLSCLQKWHKSDSNLVDFFYGWREVDYWVFDDFQRILMEIGVLGASPARSSVWCSPAVFLFLGKTTLLRKNMICHDFQMIFNQNGPNLLLTRGTTIKTGILTLIEFWWVP